jgi:hypothetical protein
MQLKRGARSAKVGREVPPGAAFLAPGMPSSHQAVLSGCNDYFLFHPRGTLKVVCQKKRGADALVSVLPREEGIKDASMLV